MCAVRVQTALLATSDNCATDRGTTTRISTMARSHPVDVHVGARMRQRRTLLGMSQTKVGEAVGLTFQQIQKYERGSNSIGSSRLYEFAKVLDVPVSHFFEEMASEVATAK